MNNLAGSSEYQREDGLLYPRSRELPAVWASQTNGCTSSWLRDDVLTTSAPSLFYCGTEIRIDRLG